MPLLALNTAFMADGVVLRIGEGQTIGKPLHVVSVGSAGDQPPVFHPRLLVLAGPGSHATVVESHVGAGVYFANGVTEVSVGPGSVLGPSGSASCRERVCQYV